MKTLIAGVVFSTVVMIGGSAYGQSQPDCVVSIKALMTAKEIETTGLRTLTSEQLDALSVWLDDYRAAIISLATDASGEGLTNDDQIIESRIDGDFDGWVGDTVFKLQNGQIWQQTSPSAKYLFAHAPKVVISPAPRRMRVEGLAGEIAVRRLK